jgi:outer membrane lipopolysaccharide assembly protein LptE/RlpB
VRNRDGEPLAEPQTVRVLRIQFQPATDILARRREAELQREDMHRELAQRVLQRVAAQR